MTRKPKHASPPPAVLTQPVPADDGDTGLDAGCLAAFVPMLERAITGEIAADVPCGTCTACCTSSQFVHIGPDETETLAHIPKRLRVQAPGHPRGTFVMGYDENGHCPMFKGGGCSIYAHRPRTCRTYDCRIFAATELSLDVELTQIARRARRFRFEVTSPDARVRQEALRRARRLLAERGASPSSMGATRLAVLTLNVHGLFIAHDDETGRLTLKDPAAESIRAALSE